MKRVLIIGASSFIGANLARYLREDYRVYGTYFTHQPKIDGLISFRLPLEPKSPLLELLQLVKPDVVVYCAAMIDDALCAQDPIRALYVNADVPLFCARHLESSGGRVVFLSSSKVFNGEDGNYQEDDTPHPAGAYGNTKLQAEEMLLRHENAFILRLGTAFGIGSQHQNSALLTRILGQLWRRRQIPLIKDEFRTFTGVDQICRAIGNCIDAAISEAGLYHLSTGERESYYTFGKTVATTFGFPQDLIRPVTGREFTETVATSKISRGNDLTLVGELYPRIFAHKVEPMSHSLNLMREQLRRGNQ